MRSKIKYLFYFSCFLLFLELAFSIKAKLDNSTNVLEIKNKIVQKKNNDLSSIYFIGDSFAETVYLTYSYPIIFDSIAKTRNYNFYDYTKSSSEFDYHEMVIDSLNIL